METNQLWNWRLTVLNQDDTGQTTSDQLEDDCQSWLLFLHVAPSLHLQKAPAHWLPVGGIRPLDRRLPSQPSSPTSLLAPQIK